MNETISVIVPFYDGNKHLSALKETIEKNVLSFKNDTDINIGIELVLVNDSPWVEIRTDKIESQLYRLTITNMQENGGIHNARVRGLCIATGKYIVFFDQDDLWSDSFLYETYMCFKDEQVGCVIANGFFEVQNEKKIILNSYGKAIYAKKYYSYLLLGNLLSSPGQCLIRKEVIPEYWKNNIMKTNCSDDLFLWCVMFKDIKVKFCNKTLYTHVNTGENVSLDKKKGYESDLEVLSYLKANKRIPRYFIKIFEMRCEYNIQKINRKIEKPIVFIFYYVLNRIFKIWIVLVDIVSHVFGRTIIIE